MTDTPNSNLIWGIVTKFRALYKDYNVSAMELLSELSFVHQQVCPLNLSLILQHVGSPAVAHDVSGIHEYLDRDNQTFKAGFYPYLAMQKRPAPPCP